MCCYLKFSKATKVACNVNACLNLSTFKMRQMAEQSNFSGYQSLWSWWQYFCPGFSCKLGTKQECLKSKKLKHLEWQKLYLSLLGQGAHQLNSCSVLQRTLPRLLVATNWVSCWWSFVKYLISRWGKEEWINCFIPCQISPLWSAAIMLPAWDWLLCFLITKLKYYND